MQTPPIGPTPPPTGNFMVEYSIPTIGAKPRGISHCRYNLCVTEYAASKVAILTTTGEFFEYATPTRDAGPDLIGGGPDNNYWFTESKANKIGRLTPTGSITEYPISTPNSVPMGIWTGDAATRLVWFTESRSDKIASINVDTGVISEYPIPTPSSDPVSISKDKDGSMWFVEHAANKVGTISSTGVITEFRVPTQNSGVQDITYVEDGNVWITEPLVGKIARVRVPGGLITEYRVPFAGSAPAYLTEGDTVNHGYDGKNENGKDHDDQVWFTDSGLDSVSGYNYDTSAFDAPIEIPTDNAGAGNVSYGPDNNIWFIEREANKVGVYHLPTPAPSSSP
ncbi:MAG TPA: hypothetical protein VKT51_08890 [Candidatus Eremiobacteraceae bacterium]|nr:hypothetical protein [Candidatus Eremiobacteraceae bacterium]